MPFTESGKVRAMRAPLYRIHFETTACRIRGLVNDCPTFKAAGRRRLRSASSVNGWLQRGEQVLQIEASPPLGQEGLDPQSASLKGTVTVGDMAVPQDVREEVMLLEFELDLARDTGAYPIVIEERFNVPTAFPEWSWLRSGTLAIDGALRTEAADVVRRVWEALRRRDLDTVVGMQPLRIREMAAAMFQKPAEREKDIRSDLGRLVNDETISLRLLDPDRYTMVLFGAKRLIRIDDEYGNAVIRYDFPEANMFAAVPLYLTRNERGRLIWVR